MERRQTGVAQRAGSGLKPGTIEINVVASEGRRAFRTLTPAGHEKSPRGQDESIRPVRDRRRRNAGGRLRSCRITHTGEANVFGEPGDPKKPARTVEIVMKETDSGKMLFAPNSVTARKGEQIRFVLKNEGQTRPRVGARDPRRERQTRDRDAQEPRHGARRSEQRQEVQARRTPEMVWRFAKAGEFDFACLIPGHREAGMNGTVVVK